MVSFRKKYRNEIIAYALIILPLLWWVVFFVFPLGRTVFMSFTDWTRGKSPNFIGFDNYIRAFGDKALWRSFGNTLLWCLMMLTGNNVFGILLAFMLTNLKSKWLQRFILAGLFWPSLVSAVIGADIQMALFGADEFGIINSLLLGIGWIKQPIAWFMNPKIALFSLMIYPFFFGFGLKLLLYYVNIKQIPYSYREAAKLETNNQFTVFWRITLPLLRPIIFLNVVLSLIDGFKVIAPMQLIISVVNGPKRETMSVVYYLYDLAFQSSKRDLGYASAISMLVFVAILIFTLIQRKTEGEQITHE